MSYGHADKIAAMAAGMAAGSEKPTPPIDPTLYHRDDMRAVLAAHDIAGPYQLLKEAGLTQRDIARLTGQSQSEVSEILARRRCADGRVAVRSAAPNRPSCWPLSTSEPVSPAGSSRRTPRSPPQES